MTWVARSLSFAREHPLLCAIVGFAFLLRLAGVRYGLPLQVVSDETPFTLAALQMIQSHTLIPALHPELFKTILPYPPYLSYILLIPFVAILGVKFLLFHGSVALFQAIVVSDLSAFFITARLLNIVLGTVSVFLVYRLAERLFSSRIAAAAASFLLATSLLHEALSMVGRNWMPVSFIFLVVLYVLPSPTWSMGRRYFWAFTLLGLGMGISSLCAFFAVFIALYYMFFDLDLWKLSTLMRDARRIAPGLVVFMVLAALPSLLYHSGNAFLGTLTLSQDKSLVGFLGSPISALELMVYSEPVLIGLFLIGLSLLLIRMKRFGILVAAWSIAYATVFYLLFRFDPRFLTPLIPLFALCAGYTVAQVWVNRMASILVLILLLVPTAAAIRLSYLAIQGDTREHAREWVLANLSPQDKVMVFSSAMHIPTQASAVDELRGVDPNALRKVDEADKTLDRHDVPYVLNNLTSITNSAFVAQLPLYAKNHHYMYLVLEPRSLSGFPMMSQALSSIVQKSSLAYTLKGLGDTTSLTESSFLDPWWTLFAPKSLGPDIVIYRLYD